MPYRPWHGRGLNEVPAAAIRGINSCREAMYGGFWKIMIYVHMHNDLQLGPFDMFFAIEYNPHIPSDLGGWGMYL
jgi:hypothetical protein